MARHRSHSVAFKRQVAQEYLFGEMLHGLAKRHDLSRNRVRVWVQKYEAGALDDDAAAADTIQVYEARIAALRGATRPADGQNHRLTVPTSRGPLQSLWVYPGEHGRETSLPSQQGCLSAFKTRH
ncbi:transposase [Methylobacterium oryzisoli]|uniref:transposase n=1 Tax=Methylobacterium oryzisoli TaxID=3385502 RepID=UPI003891D39F